MDLFSKVKSRLIGNNNNNNVNGYTPYIIVTNFKDTTEKECSKFDSKNDKRYNEFLTKAKRAHRTIDNTGLSMSLEVPPPPRPSNRDRFIIWKKRNTTKYVIPQSEAVFFLTKKGYVLNKHYEAYQAIDLSNKIKKEEGIIDNNTEDISLDFSNVYTNKDENILRRHSIYGIHQFNRNVRKFSENSYMNRNMNRNMNMNMNMNEYMSHNTRSQSMPNINEYHALRQQNIAHAGPIRLCNEAMEIPFQRSYSLNNDDSILSSSLPNSSPISYDNNPNPITPSAPQNITNLPSESNNTKHELLYPKCDI